MAKPEIRIFAWNFRGFPYLEIDLQKLNFVVGDNSSGKTSILHLVQAVLSSDLTNTPQLDEDLAVDRYDYFSPYLNNADVVFGFESKEFGKVFRKIITVERRKDGEPFVSRATFGNERNGVVISKNEIGLERRIFQRSRPIKWEQFAKEHSRKGRTKKISIDSDEYIAPGSPMAVVRSVEYKKARELNLANILTYELPAARHIMPVRELPEKYYDLKRTLTPSGKNFASMWRDLRDDGLADFSKKAIEFGKSAKLFDDFKVRPISTKIPDSPLSVTITKNGHEFFLNQVGIGLSQVVPVLVEVIFAEINAHGGRRRLAVLLQQPELHLHPMAQAELGSFIARINLGEIDCIIETHSNYLIDRFRAHLRDGEVGADVQAQILFCINSYDGNKCITCPIQENGKIDGAPSEYFDFFLNETIKTMF